MITHNRAATVQRAVERNRRLPERPRIIVVDNGSTDDTQERLRAVPEVTLVTLPANLGAHARNVGTRLAGTDSVAFSDDDCWWEPGSLAAAVELFDRTPRLAVATARVVVEPDGRVDPTCTAMSASPLPTEPGVPGTPVLGFLAGACVVRRSAFLSVGGFEARYFLGGEEELVSADLWTAGWRLTYLPELTAHHAPSAQRNRPRRVRLSLRNSLWSTWLRRPVRDAVRRTYHLVASSPRGWPTVAACLQAAAGLPWVAARRRVVPAELAGMLRLLDTAGAAR